MNPEELLTQAPEFLRALADILEAVAGGGQGEQAPVESMSVEDMTPAQASQGNK